MCVWISNDDDDDDGGFDFSHPSAFPMRQCTFPCLFFQVMEIAREFREKKKNTGKLPEPATKMLLHWFETHKDLPVGPYPSEDEKSSMCNATGLTLTQINNW